MAGNRGGSLLIVFNIGAGEMVLIALVLLIAVGPEQLPGVIRRTGQAVGQIRSMSDRLRTDFMSSMDEIERATDVSSWVDPDLTDETGRLGDFLKDESDDDDDGIARDPKWSDNSGGPMFHSAAPRPMGKAAADNDDADVDDAESDDAEADDVEADGEMDDPATPDEPQEPSADSADTEPVPDEGSEPGGVDE